MKLSRRNYFSALLAVFGLIVGVCSDKLSSEEKIAVKKFYDMVKNDLTQDIQHDEKYLVRWIRAKNHDLKEAEEMLRKDLQWRKDYKMENIFHENFDLMRKRSAFSFTYDYQGRPALTAGLGQIDVRRIVLAHEEKKLDRYIVYAFERGSYEVANAKNRTGNHDVMDGYLLFNFAGYSAKTHACLGCIPSWVTLVRNYELHYPQLAREIFLVNVPRIFEYLIDNFLRPVMSAHTARVLRVFGFNQEEWKRALLKVFPENELLQSFGGTRKIPHSV